MPAFSRFDLVDLNIFTSIVRQRSFAKAAIEHGVSASALSHRIKNLEARLGVRLLNRTTRSVVPTAAGQQLADTLSGGFEQISEALQTLQQQSNRPVGRLRLNIPRDASALLLTPILRQFTEHYPHLELCVAVDDRPVDIVAQGYDAGIRYGGTVPEDMIAIALSAPLRWVVVGSPDYLQRSGVPKHPDELKEHHCIGVHLGNNARFKWELGNGEQMRQVDVSGPFAVNDSDATLQAAINGVGLGYLLQWRASEALVKGELQWVMPEWASMGEGFYLYYTSRQYHPGLKELAEMIRYHCSQQGYGVE